MSIILLSGKRFSGKDTIAIEFPELKRISIADTMKQEFMKLNPHIDMYDRQQKEQNLHPFREFTHNIALQEWIKRTPYHGNSIVTDVRTYMEISFLMERFGKDNVKIVRLDVSDEERKRRGWSYDPILDKSYLETELDDYPFDLVVKNEIKEDIPIAVESIRKILKFNPHFIDIGYGMRRTIGTHNTPSFMNTVPMLATPIFRNKVLDHIYQKLINKNIKATHVFAIESSGFALGAWLSQKFDIGFTMGRKSKKLPPPVVAIEYSMEYREKDAIEVQSDTFGNIENPRVIICDDIIATGGTIKGAINLMTQLGARVVAVVAYADLCMVDKYEFGEPIIFAKIKDNHLMIEE